MSVSSRIKVLTDKFKKAVLSYHPEDISYMIIYYQQKSAKSMIPYCKDLNTAEFPPLAAAIIIKDEEMLGTLIESGANPNNKGLGDFPKPLDFAISKEFFSGAAALVRKGAAVGDVSDWEGYGVFHKAMMLGAGFCSEEKEVAFANVFVDREEQSMRLMPEFCDHIYGRSSSYAEDCAFIDMIEAFGEKGFDFNLRDEKLEMTPLEIVASGNADEFFLQKVATKLIEGGAVVNNKIVEIANDSGKLGLAQHLRREKIERSKYFSEKTKFSR